MRCKSLKVFVLFASIIVLTDCKTRNETKKVSGTVVSNEVKKSDSGENNSLSEAAFNGHLEEVMKLLDKGIDVNIKDQDGRTALMYAAFNGHTFVMQKLLAKGALVNLCDTNGRTALMLASSGPFPASVKLLLDYKADPNMYDKAELFTALMYAAAEGHLDIVKMLINHKADPARKDIDGDNALTFAQNNGHKEIVNLLKPLLNK